MDVTYAHATSISKALPAHSHGATISRRSVSIGMNHPEDTSLRESEPRNSNLTAILSVPNREGKVKQEEQDKGIWNFLKNKLKPKKKEKGNFNGYVESNGRQDQVLGSSMNQNEPNFSHVLNYSFLRAQCRPFHKETKFRASTIDSRRLHTQTVSSQILWRPKREEKPLMAKTRDYRPNLFYLCDGTAERIDRWLAESEAFMRADDHQSTIATAVVGSHRRTIQQTHCQTSKQSGKQDKELSTSPMKTKDMQISGINQHKNFNSNCGPNSKKPIITQHLPTNLFRQSSRSANHLPVSMIKAEAFPKHQRSRPLSDFECQEMSFNQYIENLEKPANSNIVLDNPETRNIISAASKTSLKAIESALDCEQSVKVSNTSISSGCDIFGKVPRFEDKIFVKSLESIHTNNDDISKPQSRDHSVKSEGRTQTFSSESLNNLSCNESYCTDYTPYAFEEKFRRPYTSLSSHESYQRETPFSHKPEPSAEKILLPETQVFLKIQTENDLKSIRKFISKDGSQFYHTPKMAKFVTTIYLTGDESNPDMTNINPGNTFTETPEQNAINLNKTRYHQSFDRRTKTLAQRYLENVAHESGKLEINTQFVSKDKQVPSDVPMIAPKGTEIHAMTERALSTMKCVPETLKTVKGDLHLDIDIFDLKTNKKKEGNSLWKHSPTRDGDAGKCEDVKKSVQAENILHRNMFESPRDDMKMCCSNKICDIGKRGTPSISTSPITKDRQTLKNESQHENILSVQRACSQRSESLEKKAKLKVITNKSRNSEVSTEESEIDLTIQPILEKHLITESKHLPKEKKSNYESDNESLEVFDEPPLQSCAIMGGLSQVMKRIYSKVPGSERQSPPLNSFTSRSTLSLFEEFHDNCSESPLNAEFRSSVIPSTPDLPMVGRETYNPETQTYSFEKQISPSNDDLRLIDSSDASRYSDEPLLDLRAFMTVKHNDHARIFDLCFGNSPAFNKTSLISGNDKDLTGVQISDWKSVESLHYKDSRPFYDSIQSQPKKETHISNLHAINRARAFFV